MGIVGTIVGQPSTDGGGGPSLPSGLVLRLDAANRGTTENRWDDLSGNDNHFTAASAGEFPAFVGGVCQFRKASQTHFDGPDLSALTEGEIFYLMAHAGGTGLCGWSKFGSNAETEYYTLSGATSNIYSSFGSTARYNCGPPSQDLTQYRVVNIWSATNDWQLNIDGVVEHSYTASNTVSFASATILGKSHNGYYLDADVKAVLLFDHKLSESDREVVETYLESL